jgi:hypothetical protein
LTKVLSIKINDIIGDEQFKADPAKSIAEGGLGLIANNETFAIFDNGNLYAKNAWIEGNIEALSGHIAGVKIDDKSIYTDNFGTSSAGWKIDKFGSAWFNDVTVSGKISSTIFEYNKVQTLGGAILLRSSYAIKSIKLITEIQTMSLTGEGEQNIQTKYPVEIIFSTDGNINETINGDFSIGSYCKVGSNLFSNNDNSIWRIE